MTKLFMKIFYTNKDNRLKKEIIIFGSGSHAKVVASEILKLNKYKLLGFIDEKTPINNIIYEEKSKKYRVLGKIKYLNKITNKNTFGIIGIGTNFIRERIVSDVKSINKNFKWINIISKDSKVFEIFENHIPKNSTYSKLLKSRISKDSKDSKTFEDMLSNDSKDSKKCPHPKIRKFESSKTFEITNSKDSKD